MVDVRSVESDTEGILLLTTRFRDRAVRTLGGCWLELAEDKIRVDREQAGADAAWGQG